MNELRYTLLADGPSDRALMPILTWLLRQHLPRCAIQPQWADLWRFPGRPKELNRKIIMTIEFYQCDLLFVHRDAETISLKDRLIEIRNAIEDACESQRLHRSIGVVPVRMTEAWLLFDINAIREAAGNPNGTVRLNLPKLKRLEDTPNCKTILHNLILEATELGTHRKNRFKVKQAVQRIPEYIQDFSPLRNLSAFIALEEEMKRMITSKGWSS